MCHPVRCRSCGKTTWAGCGRHVDEVQAVVPEAQWCPGCDDTTSRSLLGRLLGR